MKNKIAVCGLAGLLSMSPLFSLAADTTAGSPMPPAAVPGMNHGSSASKDDKADKKGEEASGSNSGAESHETQKDAAGSSDTNDMKKPAQ
nr:hypothetical protein [Pseudomonas fluorescens]